VTAEKSNRSVKKKVLQKESGKLTAPKKQTGTRHPPCLTFEVQQGEDRLGGGPTRPCPIKGGKTVFAAPE